MSAKKYLNNGFVTIVVVAVVAAAKNYTNIV